VNVAQVKLSLARSFSAMERLLISVATTEVFAGYRSWTGRRKRRRLTWVELLANILAVTLPNLKLR